MANIVSMKYQLRDYQQEASDIAVEFFKDKKKRKNGLVILPTGCHARGTRIIMADGTQKPIETIEVGDMLLGTDGGYRKVLELHHGQGNMYRITPKKGRPFIVNEDHILSLISTPESRHKKRRLIDISVKEYLKRGNGFKHQYKLHRLECAHYNKERKLYLEPYYMGLYIGDGTSQPEGRNANITTMHPEVEEYLRDYAARLGHDIKGYAKIGSKATSYYITRKSPADRNYVKHRLCDYGLDGCVAAEKFIPEDFLCASYEDRLQLAAGFFDTDCYYDKDRNVLEYSSKSLRLMYEVSYLMRSIGLFAGNIGEKKVNDTLYFRMSITGDLHKVPSRVNCRKGLPRKQKKSIFVTGFSVEYVGVGDYYGFTLDGNHLYCDDQFFVHHNSGKSMVIAEVANRLDGNTIVFQPSVEILEQNYAKLHDVYGYEDCGIYSASKNKKEIKRVTFATIGSVKNKTEEFADFKNIIVDECFPKDVKVVLDDESTISIGRLNTMFKAGEPLPRVMAYNERTRTFHPARITAVKETGINTVWKTRFYNGVYIQSTKNHPFLTPFGWKMQDELEVGDAVMSPYSIHPYYRNAQHDWEFRKYIIGDLLSGGRVLRNTNNIIELQIRFNEIPEYKFYKMQVFETRNHLAWQMSAWTHAPAFYLKADLSHRALVKQLTPQSLAVMYCNKGTLQDGCHMTLPLEQKYIDRIADRLFVMGVINEVEGQTIKILSKKTFFELTAQYMPRCVKTIVPKEYHYLLGTYDWKFDKSQVGVAVVCEKKYESNRRTFNIEVEKYHNYLVAPRSLRGHNTFPLIVHNCHLVNPEEGMYKRFISSIKKCRVLGLTATPYRLYSNGDFGSMLKFITRIRGSVFKDVLYYMQVADAKERGYLANVRYFSLPPDGYNRENLQRNSTGRDYTDESIKSENDRVDSYAHLVSVVKRLQHPKSGVKRNGILVFTKFVEEAERLASEIPSCEVVSNNTSKKERAKILERFKNGEIEVIANCATLVVGFDHPALDTVVFARPTMSLSVYYQALGRLIRPYKDKESWFVDVCGNIERFGHVEDLRVVQNAKGRWGVRNKDGWVTGTYLGGDPNAKAYNSPDAKEERIKKWCEENGKRYRTPEERAANPYKKPEPKETALQTKIDFTYD